MCPLHHELQKPKGFIAPHAQFERIFVFKTTRGTRSLATRLAAHLQAGDVVALVGTLGAGKTCFVQALAKALRVPALRDVVSPTYTLVNEYTGGRLPLLHFDFYRLDSGSALQALGLDEQVGREDAICAIEWADHFPEALPSNAVWVLIEPHPAIKTGRIIRVYHPRLAAAL